MMLQEQLIDGRSRAGKPAAAAPGWERIEVLGVPIACIDMGGMIAEIRRFFTFRRPGESGVFICFRDVHGVVVAQDDPLLMAAHRKAFLVVADGKPLAMLARARGSSCITQVRGIDSMPALCEAGLAEGWRHFFLGGMPGVADKLAHVMSGRFPGLVVAGTECPPFRPMSKDEADALVERVNAARPDLVWVGLGSPKQELWMAELAPRLLGAVCLGVGAAFDVHTGRVRQAPEWARRGCVEWAYRIVQEPRRLGRRYLHAIPRFLSLVAMESLTRRTHP